MIDYCIKMPEKDEYEKGHKYPYYSCELLCTSNGFNIDKLLQIPISRTNNTEQKENNSNDMETKESEEKINIIKNKMDNKDKELENEKRENSNNLSDIKKKDEDNKANAEENSEKIIKSEINENNLKENHEKKTEDLKLNFENHENETNEKILEQKKNDEPNFPLVNSVLDHLFSILEDKSSLENIVLLGYFNKITNYLIKSKRKIVIEYILINRENIINKLLCHINKYSIANIIINILNALSEDDIPEIKDKYILIVNKLIDQFYLNENDNNTIEIICDLFINCIIYNNIINLSKIIEANIINKFENIIQKYFESFEQNKEKIFFVINLLTKMNKSILSNFPKRITTTINSDDDTNKMMNLIKFIDKINIQFIPLNNSRSEFKGLVYQTFLNSFSEYCNSINNICIAIINNLIEQEQNKQNNAVEIETSFSYQKYKTLGINKIMSFGYIKTVLDIYINCLDIFAEDNEKKNMINEKIHLIVETKIFNLFIKYYFKYKNNNFFTNIMLDLIKIIFDNDKAPEELILNILQLNKEENNDNNFINLLINDIIKNSKFIFEDSGNKINNFLFGSNINILNYIYSCKNSYMNNLLNEKMSKEKFFYDNFITNINPLFSKRLYKIDDNTEKPQFDSLGVRLSASNSTLGTSNIPFSLESLDELATFYLKVYQKYLAGEEYVSLFEEREKKLEKIKKSSEYIRLGNQNKDEELETEEEEDEYDDVDIPKPVFFNSKLEEKKDVEKNDIRDENIENKKYNDINFWQVELKDESMEDILKDIL
jgi:hypothetical protein